MSAQNGDASPLCQVPDNVESVVGDFVNAQGLRLKTYSFQKKGDGSFEPKAVVFLCHGYASHTQFEWFLPKEDGAPHDQFAGSFLERLVDASFVVLTLDHQSMGRSEGLKGMRAAFESFDHLPEEAHAYLLSALEAMPQLKGLPVFIAGISMGGATASKMVIASPETYSGVILMSPMLSLEAVKEKPVFCCIKNKHLQPISGALSSWFPFIPIAKGGRNEIHPLSQKEMDEDPLTYSGDVRARTAREFLDVCGHLCDGGLAKITVPVLTLHSQQDTFTDPVGSEKVIECASTQDKTYLKIGKGLDIDADIWHALTVEPGREKVFDQILAWIQQRLKV